MSRVDVVDVDCPVCGESERKNLFEVADYSNPNFEERFGVVRCRHCGCGYLSPRPKKQDLHRYYDASFYWSWEGGLELSPEQTLARRADQIRAKKRLLADLQPGKLLDIGAMKGEFVRAMRDDGWDAEGTDFSQLPENLFNVPMRYGDFLKIDYEPESFDCITMWAVLEHVYEPAAYVQKIAKLLKPGGRLVAVVTNFNSFQGRILKQDDFPRHLTLFTKKALGQVLAASGLSTISYSTAQDVFSSPMSGGLVHLVKRMGGYSEHEVLYERRSSDKLAFCCKWRSRASRMTKLASRIDRALSLPLEALLDRLCMGHTLTTVARKAT